MKYGYRGSTATVTAVLPATEAGTHPKVMEVMEMALRDLKDHLTLGSLPSSERYWKIQIVATRHKDNYDI